MSEHLSYFLCHNFYENILSPDYIEYNLLYLIALIIVSFTFSVNLDIGSSMISSIQMTVILSILVSTTFFVSYVPLLGYASFGLFLCS